MPKPRSKPGSGRRRIRATPSKPAARSGAGPPHRPPGHAKACLLVAVVASKEALQDVVAILLDLELGGTVVDCKGLLAVLRDEVPIFGGLAAMLPAHATGSRMVFSLTTRVLARRALDGLRATGSKGIVGFAIDVDASAGLGGGPPGARA